MRATNCEKLEACLDKASCLAPTLSRLAVGWIFLESGWGKLHNLSKVTEFFQSLGIPAAGFQAPFVAGVEFLGGLCLLLGLFTRWAALPLIPVMVVAIWTAKREDIGGISDLFGLSEFLILVILVWLFFFGAGKLSIDAWRDSRKSLSKR